MTPRTRERWSRVAANHPATHRRPTGPELALTERKALASAHWTVVDRFESDGKHYVVAQRNAAFSFETLSARERQALALAARGLSNKCIAYEMGIVASTVSVLLLRAAKKLGTSSRAELIDAYLRFEALTK